MMRGCWLKNWKNLPPDEYIRADVWWSTSISSVAFTALIFWNGSMAGAMVFISCIPGYGRKQLAAIVKEKKRTSKGVMIWGMRDKVQLNQQKYSLSIAMSNARLNRELCTSQPVEVQDLGDSMSLRWICSLR